MVEGDDFAATLRRAIGRSGLSLTVISERLRLAGRPLSVASLSNWQSGRSLPGGDRSLDAVEALEDVLGLPRDMLVAIVGTPRPRGRSVSPTDMVGPEDTLAAFREALSELGFEKPQQHAHERVFHQLLIVDTNSPIQALEHRLTVRALSSGICRLPAVHVLDPGEPNIPPTYIPLEGCGLGRSVVWPHRRTYGVELIVDGELDAGQTAVLAYRVEMRAEATDVTESLHSLPRLAQEVLLEVEFRGDRRPVNVERYRSTKEGESLTPVRVDRRGRAQFSESRFGPGTFGLRWEWDEDEADGPAGF